MLYAITMLLSKKHYPIVGQDGFREHYSSRSISWAADLWLKVLIWCKTILNISIHQIIPAFPLLYNWSVVIHFSLYCVGVNLQTYDWQLQPTEANGICLYLANPNYLRNHQCSTKRCVIRGPFCKLTFKFSPGTKWISIALNEPNVTEKKNVLWKHKFSKKYWLWVRSSHL